MHCIGQSESSVAVFVSEINPVNVLLSRAGENRTADLEG